MKRARLQTNDCGALVLDDWDETQTDQAFSDKKGELSEEREYMSEKQVEERERGRVGGGEYKQHQLHFTNRLTSKNVEIVTLVTSLEAIGAFRLSITQTARNQNTPSRRHMFCHHGVKRCQSNAARQMLAVNIQAGSGDTQLQAGGCYDQRDTCDTRCSQMTEQEKREGGDDHSSSNSTYGPVPKYSSNLSAYMHTSIKYTLHTHIHTIY